MLKKTLIATTLVVLSGTALAAADGIYIGGQLGLDNTHYGNTSFDSGVTSTSSISNVGFAARAFLGYQFTQNWAAELGYAQFSNATYNNMTIGTTTGLSGNIRSYAYDLIAKGILPLNYGFDVYGTLGGAWMRANTTGSLSGNANSVFPTFGIGASYDITQNVPIDLSYRRFQRIGGSRIQSVDFYTFGVAWHFG